MIASTKTANTKYKNVPGNDEKTWIFCQLGFMSFEINEIPGTFKQQSTVFLLNPGLIEVIEYSVWRTLMNIRFIKSFAKYKALRKSSAFMVL